MSNKRLKPDHKVFADKYLETGKPRESALVSRPHLTPESASVHASRLLKNANVQAYLESHAETAVANIAFLANNAESESVRLSANKDILDRSGYGVDAKDNDSNAPVTGKDSQQRSLELISLLKSGDVQELQRIILKPS